MPFLDVSIVAVFVVGCLALGAWTGRSGRSVAAYFIGEHDIPAWAVMISIVATETSAATFLSVPGKGYRGDLRFLQLAFGYVIARVLVAIFLMPAYFRGTIQTAYEVLAIRFGGVVRTVSSILFLITRTIGSGLRLYLAAIVLRQITNWEIVPAILLIGTATVIYTYVGGLKGVVWTDVLQFAVYIGAAFVAVALIHRAHPGGWPAILSGASRAGRLRLFDFSTTFSLPYTFWGGILGATALDSGSHGADHMMVQRYLSARSEKQAAWALVASGFVILAQFALFLMIGIGIRELHGIFPPTKSVPIDGEFASFILASFPTGLLGLVVAAVFAVTMSTVSGALSASASSTVNDLIRPSYPEITDSTLMTISRAMTLFWGMAQVGVAIIAIGLKKAVVDQALGTASFLMGILLGVFILGLATKRVGASAALNGMVAAIAVVSAVAFGTKVAYPWWALIGSSTVFVVGVGSEAVRSLARAER